MNGFDMVANMAVLTKNFAIEEFRVSAEHPALAAAMAFSAQDELKAYYLARLILEPVRRAVGAPIVTLSGKRTDLLNRKVGGVATSEHRWLQTQAAVDWRTQPRTKLWEAYDFIRGELRHTIGQAIIYLQAMKTGEWMPQFIHTSIASEAHQGEFLVKLPDGTYETFSERRDYRRIGK